MVVPRLPGTPVLGKDGLYLFTGGGLELTVDPRRAGVVRFSLDGRDALLPADAPPGDYTAEVEGSSLLVTSPTLGVSKRFRLDTARRSVEVACTLTNLTKDVVRTAAASQVRVASAGGLTLFPGAHKLGPNSTLRLNVWQPVVWFPHDQVREPKLLEASVESTEGWVASVNQGMLLVMVAAEAANPVIHIASAYDATSKLRPWVEVATRSELELGPGASETRNARLFLRRLPVEISAKPGNQELVGFVRGVIQ